MIKHLKYVTAIVLTLLLAGCFGALPVQKVKKDPIPTETSETQEQTRQALDAILYFTTKELQPEVSCMLIEALLVRYGQPTKPIEYTLSDTYDLSIAIKVATKNLRDAIEDWKVNYNSKDTYEQGQKTFVQKAITGFWTIVIIAGLLMLLCPTVVIGAVRWFRGRIEKAKAAIEEEKEYQKRKADQTVEAIRKFRKVNPEGFEALEPHLKESHDKDIQADIKNGRL